MGFYRLPNLSNIYDLLVSPYRENDKCGAENCARTIGALGAESLELSIVINFG